MEHCCARRATIVSSRSLHSARRAGTAVIIIRSVIAPGVYSLLLIHRDAAPRAARSPRTSASVLTAITTVMLDNGVGNAAM